MCARSGVQKISLGDIKIDFTVPGPETESPERQPAPEYPTEIGSYDLPPNKKFELQDKEVFAEVERSQNLIEDPLAFEQGVIDDFMTRDSLEA